MDKSKEKIWYVVQNGKKLNNAPMTLDEANAQRDRMIQALQESGQAAAVIEVKQAICG